MPDIADLLSEAEDAEMPRIRSFSMYNKSEEALEAEGASPWEPQLVDVGVRHTSQSCTCRKTTRFSRGT